MGTSAGKIVEENQVDWYASDTTVLDYRMLFEKDEFEPPVENKQVKSTDEKLADFKKLLKERELEHAEMIEEVKAEAYAKGLEDGRAEGRREAEEKIDQKISVLEEGLKAGRDTWKQQQEMLNPGLLDLVFEITESILEIPVENPAIRKKLDAELAAILPKIDEKSKPILKVSNEDHEYISRLVQKYSAQIPIVIQADNTCNPGEFEVETDREALVLRFKSILADFKKSLVLPSWK